MQCNHWATIAKSGETKRVLDADSEEMKDESKFEVFTKLQRILLQKMHQMPEGDAQKTWPCTLLGCETGTVHEATEGAGQVR